MKDLLFKSPAQEEHLLRGKVIWLERIKKQVQELDTTHQNRRTFLSMPSKTLSDATGTVRNGGIQDSVSVIVQISTMMSICPVLWREE